MKRSIAAILCAMTLNSCGNPTELSQAGEAAYDRKDYHYQLAFKNFSKAAEQGETSAQYSLGVMYFKGQGVPQDYKEAIKWWSKAAEQGKADAQYNLGVMYFKGQGVPQDYKEAVKWFRKSAERGSAMGQFKLGVMYAIGTGVPRDDISAHMWLNLAAANSSPDLMEGIAKMRDTLEGRMTEEQIAEAQRLAREWKPKKQERPLTQ